MTSLQSSQIKKSDERHPSQIVLREIKPGTFATHIKVLPPDAEPYFILGHYFFKREEAEEAARTVGAEAAGVELKPAWGNIFTFADLKDRSRAEVFADPALRRRIIESLLDPLTEAAASQYFLYQLKIGRAHV